MSRALRSVMIGALAASLAGCAQKKPVANKIPPQAQAPTTTADATGRGTLTPPTIGQQQDAKDLPPLPETKPADVQAPPPAPAPEEKPKHNQKNSKHNKGAKPAPDTTKPDTTKPDDTSPKPAAQDTPAATSSTGTTTTAQQAPAQPTPAPAATKPVQTAEAPDSATSPIGQLTTGDSAAGAQTKRDTKDLINETESGLKGIKRPLSREEQTTATKIRTFLTQARQALQNGDTEGAHTLATKAKLLLDELTAP